MQIIRISRIFRHFCLNFTPERGTFPRPRLAAQPRPAPLPGLAALAAAVGHGGGAGGAGSSGEDGGGGRAVQHRWGEGKSMMESMTWGQILLIQHDICSIFVGVGNCQILWTGQMWVKQCHKPPHVWWLPAIYGGFGDVLLYEPHEW